MDLEQQVIEAIAADRLAGAIDLCVQMISTDPDSLKAHWYLGLAQLLTGDTVEAQAVWISAIGALDPEEADQAIEQLLNILLIEAKRRCKQPHLQEPIYLQALEIAPDLGEIYLELGRATALQGRLDDAIELWQQSAAARSGWAEPYLELAAVWQRLGQLSEAIEAYSAVARLRSDWEIYYKLGGCLAQVGQWQAAIEAYRQAIDLNPEVSSVWGDLGGALMQQGETQEAIHCWFAAVDRCPDFVRQSGDWAETPQEERPRSIAQFLNLLKTRAAQAEVLQSLRSLFPVPPVAKPELAAVAHLAGYYETAQAALETGEVSDYIPLDPPSLLLLQPPRSLDDSIHFSFRFGHAVPLPQSFVVKIPQGQFWLNEAESSSAVLTATGRLLGDLSPEFPLLSPGHPDRHPSRHSLLQQGILQTVRQVRGTIAVLAGLTNNMYFHWMFDVLPRIDLLRRSGVDWREIDGFVVNCDLPFQQETLELLGVPAAKILRTQDYAHIQADRLIVPSFPAVPAWMPSWTCEFLRSAFLKSCLRSNAQTAKKRLYITRHLAANRRVINEAEIINFLTGMGFEAIELERLTVLEQANLFASAEIVISPHGGGLTNLVFCSSGTKVIEFFSPRFVYPCYWLISNLVNLEYFYLLGRIPEGEWLHQIFYSNPRLEDIFVELSELKQLLCHMSIL